MPSYLARLHAKIRREKRGLQVEVAAMQNGVWGESNEVAEIEWSRVESVAERIFGLIAENNLHRRVENAHLRLTQLGQELFQCAFQGSIGGRISGSLSEFLILDLEEDGLGIPWELAHDGIDFLGRRFAVGRKVSGWEGKHSHRPRPVGKCSTLLLSNPSGDLLTAAQEGEFLSALLGRDLGQEVVWLNGQVDCEGLRNWLLGADVFHFCGHFQASIGMEPGWVLADRTFTRSDLLGSIEKGKSPPLLIFNNACHSCPTGPDDSTGSENAFVEMLLQRGCVHYIGAYLKVLDHQASDFARAFYQKALEGTAIGSALRQARLEFGSSHASDQLTWAQYVLYGDPTKGLLGKTALIPEVHSIVFGDSSPGGNPALEVQSAFPGAEFVLEGSEQFAILFPRPSEAVRFSLLLQKRFSLLETEGKQAPPRLAIASGEILVERGEESGKAIGLQGYPLEVGRSLLGLAREGQILTTRPVHENARAALRGKDVYGGGRIAWLDHGRYVFDLLEDPLDVCEVGEEDAVGPFGPPQNTEHAHRSITPDQEPVLGWRPALDTEIPTSPDWILTEKLGAGGFGEVWRARNSKTGETRVFKFCFQADRVRSLKREATLFRVLRDRLGPHPHIVRIHEVFFEEPPFYISMEDIQGLDLGRWCARYCQDDRIDEGLRLEIVAKVADALQAAHDTGVIHRDVKPSNILVEGTPDDTAAINIKLTDFGIGRLESKMLPVDFTAMGFTETYRPTEMSSGSGSRLYMAPELLVGKDSSIRSDIYSLGMVLYQILLQDCDRPLTVDWERDIGDPILLEDLRGCLSGIATERFSSAGEVAERLRSIGKRREDRRQKETRHRTEVRRKRFTRLALGAMGLSLLLVAALGYGLRRAWIERENLERSLYHSRIQEAFRAIAEPNPTRAREILNSCPERFRSWEWGYLVFKCNTDHRAFGHEAPISTFDLSPDNRYLATGGEDGSLRVWDFDRGGLLWETPAGGPGIQAIAIDGESRLIAVSLEREILVRGLVEGDLRRRLHPPTPLAGVLRFAPDQNVLAAADEDFHLALYDLTGDSSRVIDCNHTAVINDFLFTPDGSKVITAGSDSKCHLIDFHSGEILLRQQVGDSPIASLAVDLKGETVAALTGGHLYTGTMEPFNLGVTKFQVGGEGGGMDFSPNARVLALNLDSHQVQGINLDVMGVPWRQAGGRGGPRSIRFSRDGRFMMTLDEDGRLRQRPVRPGAEWDLNLRGHTRWVLCLAFNPDGSRIATGSEDGTVVIWDTKTGEEVHTFITYEEVEAIAFSGGGDRLAAGTKLGEVFVWNPVSGERLCRWNAHEGQLVGMDFHPEGKGLATKGPDGTIRVWAFEGEAVKPALTIEAAPGPVLSYSPDGKTLFSNAEDFGLQEWDSESGEGTVSHLGHKRPVFTLDFFPDGTRFASGDEVGEILIWDRQSGQKISSFQSQVTLTHELLITPDAKRMITSVEIWDLENFRPIIPIPVDVKALSPDGHHLAIGGSPGRLHIEGVFPTQSADFSAAAGRDLEKGIEAYKRAYWRERQATATGLFDIRDDSAKKPMGITGQWDFDRRDLTATWGRDLEYFQRIRSPRTTQMGFGTAGSFGLPQTASEERHVMFFRGASKETGFRLFSNASSQYEDHLLAYTILFDIYYPKETENLRRALYNTDSSNSSAAELVVSCTGGLGVEGVYHGRIESGRWHRIACAVNLSGQPKMAKFIDGEPVGTQILTEKDEGRWSIEEGRRGRCILILAGRDCDDAPCYLDCVQFRNYAMSEDELRLLGPPSSGGFPIMAASPN